MSDKTSKKKNKVLILAIIILSVLLAVVTYTKILEQKENEVVLKEAHAKINKLEKEKDKSCFVEGNNYITSNLFNMHNGIKIYSIGYMEIIYSYNGLMYRAFSEELENSHLLNLLSSENPTKSSEKGYYTVQKLNINEKDISKVIMTENFYSKEASEYTYIINKDGNVKRYDFLKSIKGENILKSYKVKDFKVSCGKNNGEVCTMLKYDLTLQDGTTKTVEEK